MSADTPPLPPEVAAMLNEATLLHSRCGRRVAEHPYGSIHLPCPYPELPPREFRQAAAVPDPRGQRATGAGIIRNRCAFTPRDMGADWPEAFTYAVVMGWDADEDGAAAMDEMATRWGWDEAMVAFLRDAHRRFQALADRTPPKPTHRDPVVADPSDPV